ncbi:MAG: hypothetical protein U0517_01265 [Candidatus Andersenbacteria bacterium]
MNRRLALEILGFVCLVAFLSGQFLIGDDLNYIGHIRYSRIALEIFTISLTTLVGLVIMFYPSLLKSAPAEAQIDKE